MLRFTRAFCLSCGLVAALSPAAGAQTGDSTTSGASRAFNPAISLNALMLGHALDGPAEAPAADDHAHAALPDEGISLQELELRFTTDVDAYARADATIAAHDGEIEIEEVYADILTLPAGLGLRAGQFYVPFSRENTLHTHQLPFVQRSLVLSALFPEGWSAPAVQLSWLPALPFYLEFRGAALDASDTEWFGAQTDGGMAGLGQIESLLELGESTALGARASAVTGRNAFDETSSIASAGVDLRWKPTRRTIYRGLRLTAEYTWADRDGADTAPDPELARLEGWTANAQYQFARRWWVSGRYDRLDPRGQPQADRWGASVSFVASEFQALRLEYASTDDGEDLSRSVFLQYNITLGSHPAHSY